MEKGKGSSKFLKLLAKRSKGKPRPAEDEDEEIHEAEEVVEKTSSKNKRKAKMPNDDEGGLTREDILSMLISHDEEDVDYGEDDVKGEAKAKPSKRKGPSNTTRYKDDDEEIASIDDDRGDAASNDGFEEDDDRMLKLADKITADDEGKGPVPRRKVLQGGRDLENRFATGGSKSALSLSDLLGEDQAEGKGQLKKRLEKLSSSTSRGAVLETFTPAIPKVEQDRADRRVGYEQATQKLDNWEGIVLANRKAKLSFPLNEKASLEKPSIHNLLPKSMEPRTELEKELAAALAASGLASEKQMLENEKNSLKNLPDQEDAQKRHAELAKMRALMFYSEQKAKRIKKIKSKTFRKLRKKRLSREEEQALAKLREEDPEAAKEYDEKVALQRAQERMSLRHKNTSKNMRELGKRHKFEDGSHELARKMGTITANGDSDDDDEDTDDEDEDEALERLATDHLESIQKDMEDDTSNEGDDKNKKGAKGLLGMEFMKRGMRREREQALKEAQSLVKALKSGDDAEEDEEEVELALGKKSFGGGAKPSAGPVPNTKSKVPLFESVEFSDNEEEEEIPKQPVKKGPTQSQAKSEIRLTDENKPSKKSTGSDEANGSKVTSNHQTSTEAEGEGTDDAAESNPWLAPVSTTSIKTNGKKKEKVEKTNQSISVSKVLEKIEQDVEEEEEENAEHQELVRRAFADVIQQDFADEKAKLEEEKRKEEEEPSGKMPGWGSWAGLGVSAAPPARKKAKIITPQLPVTAPATKPNLIVSMRTNKLQKKYQVDQVPYPFTSREQYERSLQNPVGPEWNTTNQFQKKVQPDVTVKVGAIIQPIKFSKSGGMSGVRTKPKKAIPHRKKF